MIKVQEYGEGFFGEWNEFVETKARNSTFLHTRNFLQHNPKNQELDSSLIFIKNSHLICVVPAVLHKVGERSVFNSHAYSTYGGFVVSDKVGVEEAIEIVDLTIQFAKEKNADEIIIRNPFRIFNQIPTDETDYAMWLRGFQLLRRDVEIAIQLSGFNAQTIDSLYDGKTRNAVRKAKKENIEVKVTKDFLGYWNILSENLSEKHEAKPTHTLEQFELLESLVGDEKIKLFGAYLADKLIAGIVLFVANKQAVHAQYIAGLREFQNLRPVNLLIHQISVWAIENGFQYFNLGMSTNLDGSGINAGLSKFKESFGGRSVLRETMRLALN